MIIARRMTRNPVTATLDMSIGEASDLMKREKVHRLPVLDKDKNLVGVITEKDILHASPSPASSLSIHEMAYLLSKLTVKKLMTKNPVTISEDTTVEEAARLMSDQDLSCLPVVNGTKLVGIVTKSDMFRILLELFGHVAHLALHLLEFRVLEHDLLRVDGSDRVGGEGRAREDESR